MLFIQKMNGNQEQYTNFSQTDLPEQGKITKQAVIFQIIVEGLSKEFNNI